MMVPLVPVRCVPSDFMNPFPSLYGTTALCSVLLLLQTLALFWFFRGSLAPLQRCWQGWAKSLVVLLTTAVALGGVGLTIWIWLQSRSFIVWCAGFARDLSGQEAAYQTAKWGMQIIVIVTAFLLLVSLIVVLLRRWQGPRTMTSAIS